MSRQWTHLLMVACNPPQPDAATLHLHHRTGSWKDPGCHRSHSPALSTSYALQARICRSGCPHLDALASQHHVRTKPAVCGRTGVCRTVTGCMLVIVFSARHDYLRQGLYIALQSSPSIWDDHASQTPSSLTASPFLSRLHKQSCCFVLAELCSTTKYIDWNGYV